MVPIAKAIWFIESHSAQPLCLDDVAAASGVSRSHLARLFPLVTGRSVLGYLRARRLSEAAKRLADGAPDILAVALDAGYASHEAFTRAFRDQFATTPEAVRRARTTKSLPLLETMRMDAAADTTLPPPRFVDAEPMLIAGLAGRFGCDDAGAIPALWQRFAPHIAALAGRKGDRTFGVSLDAPNEDGVFHYLAGVEVRDSADLPRDFSAVRLPAQRYAVFSSRSHVASIRAVIGAIHADWLPTSGLETGPMPALLESYGPSFDPRTGRGGFEIWVPIAGGATDAP